MKDETGKVTGVLGKLTWIAIGLGVLSWILEAAIHVTVFQEGSFASQIFSPNAHEIWMRLFVLGLFVGFGAYAQFTVNRRTAAEEASEHALAELKLTETELNQILDTVADGVCVIDRHFTIIRTSDTFLTLLGISQDEAIGRTCYEVSPCPLCKTPECPMTQILYGAKRVECEAVKEREDGTRMSCTVVATPVRKLDGEIVGIVKNFRLPCERVPAEE